METAHGPFFFDEEHRIEGTRGIIQGHNQIPLTAGHPFMSRAVLMEHHTGQGSAGPLLAMRPTPGRSRHLQRFIHQNRPSRGPAQPTIF